MPKLNPKTEAIREAKFIKALAEHGTATEAYKAVNPHVTRDSAAHMGSKTLSKIQTEDINALYERIGCTKEAVLTQLYARLQKTRKDQDFAKLTSLLVKIGGWDSNKSALADILKTDMDLVEVIKVRLRKSKGKKDLPDIIDVESKSSDDLHEVKA
jgi:hypothetical protein